MSPIQHEHGSLSPDAEGKCYFSGFIAFMRNQNNFRTYTELTDPGEWRSKLTARLLLSAGPNPS